MSEVYSYQIKFHSTNPARQCQLLKTGPAGAIFYRSGRMDLPSALLTTRKHELRYLQQMV